MGNVGVFLLILHIHIMFASSLSEKEVLLVLKKSLKNTDSLASWDPGSDPCAAGKEWNGLICSSGVVSDLRLGQMGLSGAIDVNALLQLPFLRSISLANNAFSGPIPEFNKLGAIKAIYLTGNKFSGEIAPDFFAPLGSLRKLYLPNNKFSGPIPLSLTKLPNLVELSLENNEFSGTIPTFEQPGLEFLRVSNNKLQGEIPPSLSKFNASSFEGNPDVCGEKVGRPCAVTAAALANVQPGGGTHKSAAGLVSVVVVVMCLMCVGLLVMRRRTQERFEVLGKEVVDEHTDIEVRPTRTVSKKDVDRSKKGAGANRGGGGRGKGVGDLVLVTDEKGVFGMPDLMKASAEVLGNGSVGSSYKASMANGVTVVVKRMKEMNKVGKDEFDAEIRRFARLRHQNILTPLAYHYRKDEKLLVHEFIPKGSLLYLLHGDRGTAHAELDWPTRLKIIKGIARGMSCLHSSYSSSNLPHGDLKSSNVLIKDDYEPVLSDYGLNQFLNNSQAAKTLFAYKSPEAAQSRNVSPKSDVYCLGVLILEIITGKLPSQYLCTGKGGIDVVQWVKTGISEKKEAELIDPELTNSKKYPTSAMEKLLHIGADCAEANPEQRPDMKEAIRRTDEIPTEGKGEKENKTVKELSGQQGKDSNAFDIS